ncbi:MAG: RagB/SusD family nutrient uptake outer membrane protein [Flammeovirgaceae bacterium]|nr:RagB/SusD family nutrient uptake outer membrane protein [Flammeovirgaceae bacterium]
MKKIFLTILLASAFYSCDLDTVNQAALSPALALDNAAGVQSTVLSGYRRMHEFAFYGQEANLHGDAFADNIEIVNRTGRYEQEWINGIGVFANRWAVCYRAILDANYVLKYLPLLDTVNTRLVPKTTPATATSFWADDILAQLEGEARFIRAFAYMELLRVYAYEPGREVNGFNLGVIIRDTPTETVSDADFRTRSTNLECYEFVEDDLLAATTLMKTPAQIAAGSWPAALGAYNTTFRATRATAHALLARLYLYWGRYADADTQATTALTILGNPLPVTAANFAGSWSATVHPESIFELEIRPTDWSGVSGPNDSMHSITQNALGGAQYVMCASAELLAAHEAGDVRRNVYVTSAATLSKPQVRKWQGEKGAFVENVPVIRRSELYLIQAESRARTNNDAGAQTAVNTIRTNRGLAATTLTSNALIDLIMNERRLEFAFEGHRFFDLKRLGRDIPKTVASGVNTLPYTDFRILQQIPPDQVVLNSLLDQNPGY